MAASGRPGLLHGSREDLLGAAFRHASANELDALAAEVAAAHSPWERIRFIVTWALAQPGRPLGRADVAPWPVRRWRR